MATKEEEEAARKAAAEGKSPELLAAEKAAADAQAEVDKWKAMSRKHEDQAKGNADAAKKLKDAEDAAKTAEERAAARLAEVEKRIADTEARAMRAEVAAVKGLTPAQAKRLHGSTVEELEADADELLESFKPADTEGEPTPDTGEKPGGKPKEALKGGASSDEQPEEDLSKVLSAIPRA